MRLARVYDPPQPDDGVRVLADRLWPRGVRKDDPRIDRWIKDVAPSSPLRQWYGHDPDRHDEFVARYEHELDEPGAAAALDQLRELAASGPVTLLTSSKDVEGGHLVVLARMLAGG
ncbi:DUF488 domain-containing protein [Mycobacterium sp.]|jgi:uncharacterized protein YeaO (DUF488 family)|uniref:DUF488 domain-containing protein n=1 Tax=Mycobacterium sp. TaxID=1785 RepID=UPI002D5E829B|nr:DUF488 family protein [Mycobacterium sp.]HZA10230.1 DUF488 family protein [Mycobacterium sp.]